MLKNVILVLICLPLFPNLNLQNLSLYDVEEIALEYNKALLIAKQNVLTSNERKSQAVSRFLPSFNYRAEFRDISKKEIFFNVFSEVFPFSHQGYSSILEMNQEIFSTDLIFGLKSKNYELAITNYDEANTKNELLLIVRDRYFEVVLYEKMLKIQKENIDYLSYALKQEQGRLEAGSRTPFEVNQSKTSVANAISLYYTTLKKLKTARNSLVIAMGIDPLLEPDITLQDEEMPIYKIPMIQAKLHELNSSYAYQDNQFPQYIDFEKHILKLEKARKLILFSKLEVDEFLEMAVKNRPDLQARKAQTQLASEHVNAKIGTYLPKVSGYMRYSYNDVDLGPDPFFDQNYHLSGGIVLSWNLFDSLLREHEIKEARSIRSTTKIQYEKELQRIEVEIRNGLYQLEEAILTYLSSSQAVLIAEQAKDQAMEKLHFGRIAPLEYRDSVNLLYQAKNNQNQASYDLLAAYYELRYATGLDIK